MIIRVTVNDNDFYYVLMGFMKNMWDFRVDKTLSVTEQIEAHRKHFDIMRLINPNNDKKLTDEEKGLLLSYIKESFTNYINRTDKSEGTKQYLINHFECKMQKTFTDKWENGEAFYWLQHSNKVINQ